MGVVDLPGDSLTEATAEIGGFVTGHPLAGAITGTRAVPDLAGVTGPDLGQTAGQFPVTHSLAGHGHGRRTPAIDHLQKLVALVPCLLVCQRQRRPPGWDIDLTSAARFLAREA